MSTDTPSVSLIRWAIKDTASTVGTLSFALGEAEDLILGLYTAYRQDDLDALVDGVHPEVEFKPVPSARTYRGRDEIRLLFERDIYELAEFDFRVLSVQERDDRVLLHGKNRIRDEGSVHDAPIYWVGEFRDRMLRRFMPFGRYDDALAALDGAGPLARERESG